MKGWASLKVVLPLLLVLPVGYRASTWLLRSDPKLKFDVETSQAGRELFMHEWTPNDPLAANGDGLGPVFNAASCVACHKQGSPGGGGPVENNVTVFTSVDKENHEANQGVVHANATEDDFRESLRNVSMTFPNTSQPALADLLPSGNKGCISPPRIGTVKGTDITQRNTPALFGADLIDAIPDRIIIANERKQRLKWGLSDSDTDDFPVGRAIRLSEKKSRQVRLEGAHQLVVGICAGRLCERVGAGQSVQGTTRFSRQGRLPTARVRFDQRAMRSNHSVRRLAAPSERGRSHLARRRQKGRFGQKSL